ncbi:MAG: hypothetical protein Q9222_000843 [Ikaeria aurantiellina]
MIGAHTDSPVLRVKPVSKKQAEGFIQVGVETYGGFDRDLSIAGRVMVKTEKGEYVHKLVKIDKPSRKAFLPWSSASSMLIKSLVLRIPTLAIHLDRQETFAFNKETQLFPIAGMVAAELNRTKESTESKDPGESASSDQKSGDPFSPLKASSERHHPYLVELIANDIGVESSAIADFEMVLYDTQKACIGGLNEEFIFSARLDNLGMSYCSTAALINSLSSPSALDQERCIRLISLFDHEEIGSQTAQGADSNLLPAVIRRLCSIGSGDKQTAYEQTLATSFLVSADMAHSVNPNYAGKYENDHKPEMNKGTVIKINANARYATNAPGIVLIEEAARRRKVPLQLFVVRNDSSCGSTIGPMLAAALGTRTLDLGNPQLSMHSIRETGGVYDVDYGIRLFEGFFGHFSELEGKILVD